MGTYTQATVFGFVCRLCSEFKRSPMHIYSKKAYEMNLLEKLKFLPITIEQFDNLPKLICMDCIDKLNKHVQLVEKIKNSFDLQGQHQMMHLVSGCPKDCPLKEHNVVDIFPKNVASTSHSQ